MRAAEKVAWYTGSGDGLQALPVVFCHLLQQELQACLVPGWQLSLCRTGPTVGSCEKQKEGGLRTMARKHAETLMGVKARTAGTKDLNTGRRGRSLLIGCPDPHTYIVSYTAHCFSTK